MVAEIQLSLNKARQSTTRRRNYELREEKEKRTALILAGNRQGLICNRQIYKYDRNSETTNRGDTSTVEHATGQFEQR